MILIELAGGRVRPMHMEFHPRLTIVDGLSGAQRHDMIQRIGGAISGRSVGFRFEVDIAGEPQPLTPQAMDRIGFAGARIDNAIDAKDLPGLHVNAGSDQQTSSHARARMALKQAQDRLRKIDAQMQIFHDRPGEGAYEDVAQRHGDVSESLQDLRAQLQLEITERLTPEDKERKAELARRVESAIKKRIEQLSGAVDPNAVARQESFDATPAEDLIDEWERLDAAVAQEVHQADLDRWEEADDGQRMSQAKQRRAEIFAYASSFGERPLQADQVVDALRHRDEASRPSSSVRTNALRRDLAVAVLDLNDIRREQAAIANLRTTDADTGHLDELRRRIHHAEADEVVLRRRMEDIRQRTDALKAAGITDERDLQRERTAAVEALDEAQFRAARFGRSPIQRTADTDGETPTTDEDVELYVLSRARAMRDAGSGGESMPLLIDAAFDGMPEAVVARLLQTLARISTLVQVVYFASNGLAVNWAERQDESLTAVVRLEAASG